MELRPSSARWFEVVVPEADAGDTMEALARRGRVQFEWTGAPGDARRLDALAKQIARYRALARQCEPYWPAPVFERRCCTLPVEVAAEAALRQIERWHRDAAPLLERLEDLEHRLRVLGLWGPMLESLSGSDLDLGALGGAGPVLAGVCLLTPLGNDSTADLPGGLHADVPGGRRRVLLGVVPREALGAVCAPRQDSSAECIPVPAWFSGSALACARELPLRVAGLQREARILEQELRRLADARGVHRAAGVMERVDWFRETARNIRCDGRYCWITGWTSEGDGGELDQALRDVGVKSDIAFMDPPVDAPQPSVLHNPVWLRPFEVFTRAVGVPGVKEADPTTWVALLVPLLFGYMCGDVGHGAVILSAGLLLRRRTRLWPLLVFCGAAATVFGFVYGGVFGYEHLLEPLWVAPMDDPLVVLLVPLLFGALVLSGGVLLHVVQTCWRGQGRSEGAVDAAQLLVYWGILLAFLDPRLAWLSVIGAALCAANRWWAERTAISILAALGGQLESTFSLLLNTLSFARVGAFALAHAALETAIMGIADGASTLAGVAVIVVVGNLLVIVLEGVVVSIQTTRLVLFEFFVRFFEGGGRPFRPASPPPAGPAPKQTR